MKNTTLTSSFTVCLGSKSRSNNAENILLLSHGNAEVERGFSVNKNLLQENICGKSLIARRLFHQAIRKERCILNIKIEHKMMIAVKLASQRCAQHLRDR